MGKTIVIGGGLAGLIAARTLAAQGEQVTLLEATDALGGRVQSRTVDGFTLDRGFQVLFTAYPAVRQELDLEALQLRSFAPGAVLAGPGHRSILGDPLRDPASAVPTMLNRTATLGDKLRLLWLQYRLRAQSLGEFFTGPDMTIHSYLTQLGFSKRIIDRFFRPFYGGITLDRSLSSSKRIFEYTFRMVATGSIAVPAAGMGAITTQVADQLRETGAQIRRQEPVTEVNSTANGVSVATTTTTYQADSAIVATDAPTAASLTGVAAIPTTGQGVTTQYYAAPRAVAPTGSRILLNAHDETPNQIVPLSGVAPEYGTDERALFCATFIEPTPGTERDRATETRQTLAAWFPERTIPELTVLATDQIDFAQFKQPPGIHERLPTVDAPAGPVYLAGEYTHWSSIQGAMASGREAAETRLTDRD